MIEVMFNQMKRIYSIPTVIFILAGILSFVIVLLKIENEATPEIHQQLAKRWYMAVNNRDWQLAIDVAEKIVPYDTIPRSVSPEYIRLCSSKGVSPAFLFEPFSPVDVQYWYHALFFKRLADQIVKGRIDRIPALFAAVTNRLESTDPSPGYILWPHRIWSLGKGVCDRQAWVLCELAYQCGYETQIVYLRDPETLRSPHTICELRKDSEVWVADPLSDVLLKDKSISDFLTDPHLGVTTWPDRKDWQRAITKPFFLTPAYPQDYCRRNQLLFQKLSISLPAKCPKFGEEPAQRLQAYEKYLSLIENIKTSIGLWEYPFRLLATQFSIVNQSPRIPDNR